ncbi:DUF2690 domain-containing protein [Streptacidiphilus monticola]|uniref:DUF2690 domain-containing protein n=1 Tax=Streptacidiphilus monticola TaxID=2161674 RepID=A0ABW1GA82_9ACTN
MTVPRKLRLGLAVLAAAGMLICAHVPQASASVAPEGCTTSCDGSDPVALGCANDATTVASATYTGGTVLLRWSPSCKVNWAATENINPFWCVTLHVERKAYGNIPANSEQYRYCNGLNPSSNDWAWTDVVYAPQAQARAWVQLDNGATISTPWV